MNDTYLSLAHGNGGKKMRQLIHEVFYQALQNTYLTDQRDAAHLSAFGNIAFTCDGFSVDPLFFPGGSIGSLAIHGTVNDLAVSGALPRFLTLSIFLEEGLAIAELKQAVQDLAQAANQAQVQVVAGDTKVLPRGQVPGMLLSVSGIGAVQRPDLALATIREGDVILVSGGVGEHGAAVLLARQSFGLSGNLLSDSKSIVAEAQALWALPGLRFLRDPTRGGLGTVLHEIALGCSVTVRCQQDAIPIAAPVQSVCQLLGLEPLYLACEGRLVAVVAKEEASKALTILQSFHPSAAIIGEIDMGVATVILETALGGRRRLSELQHDPLPRIC
jgi:hydrogenase expression/formation protein HypE